MSTTNINCSIITIGDELLIGQTIDTNSAFIAQQLNKVGVWIKRRVAVGDVYEDIWNTLTDEGEKSQIVIITGGLGPTSDDITKPLLCKYFGGALVVHEPTLQHIKSIFELLKRPLLDANLKQAELPNNCTVLPNLLGTAAGMWFEKNKVVYISLPGVPTEMQGLITNEVIPRLLTQFAPPVIMHKNILTAGMGESFIAERLVAFEQELPQHIKLAYLPNYSFVRLRLTATAYDSLFLENELSTYHKQLQALVTDIMVTNTDETIEQLVANLLLQNNATVATAESCTGGYIAHALTSIAGSSAYYNGSIIAYAYSAKEDLLKVSSTELHKHGAVSEAIVTQMVNGVLQQLKTTYAIATTGIMGPGGATPNKPVGTVWIAVASKSKLVAKQFHFRWNRKKNIELTTLNALNMLRELILAS